MTQGIAVMLTFGKFADKDIQIDIAILIFLFARITPDKSNSDHVRRVDAFDKRLDGTIRNHTSLNTGLDSPTTIPR